LEEITKKEGKVEDGPTITRTPTDLTREKKKYRSSIRNLKHSTHREHKSREKHLRTTWGKTKAHLRATHGFHFKEELMQKEEMAKKNHKKQEGWWEKKNCFGKERRKCQITS